MPSNASASTIKIRNLAHLLQQLDELGQPVSSVNSDDQDGDRHLYASSGSHHGSGSGRSAASGDQRSRGICPRHPVAPTLSLDSQLVEQDLAYLLAGTGNDGQGFRRPRTSIPNNNRMEAQEPGQRFALPFHRE